MKQEGESEDEEENEDERSKRSGGFPTPVVSGTGMSPLHSLRPLPLQTEVIGKPSARRTAKKRGGNFVDSKNFVANFVANFVENENEDEDEDENSKL